MVELEVQPRPQRDGERWQADEPEMNFRFESTRHLEMIDGGGGGRRLEHDPGDFGAGPHCQVLPLSKQQRGAQNGPYAHVRIQVAAGLTSASQGQREPRRPREPRPHPVTKEQTVDRDITRRAGRIARGGSDRGAAGGATQCKGTQRGGDAPSLHAPFSHHQRMVGRSRLRI